MKETLVMMTNEEIIYSCNFEGATSISDPKFVMLDGGTGKDITARHASGEVTVNGSVISSPSLGNLEAGKHYVMRFGALLFEAPKHTWYEVALLCINPHIETPGGSRR